MITDFSWSDKHQTYFVRDGGRWRKARVGDLSQVAVERGGFYGAEPVIPQHRTDAEISADVKKKIDLRLQQSDLADLRSHIATCLAEKPRTDFVVPATIAAVVILIVVFVVALS